MVIEAVTVATPDAALPGNLVVPGNAQSVVLFAHGSGSSRFSSRNRHVAGVLNEAGLGTLLFDLLTKDENEADQETRRHRFDIALLTRRLTAAVDWMGTEPTTQNVPLGLFGASTGAAAALATAAERRRAVRAVVSRGGRPDLAEHALPNVKAPTLLIVGQKDDAVIGMNEEAARQLTVEHRVAIVPGASHLFEEPGALNEVAELARDWFLEYLDPRKQRLPGTKA